MRRKLVLSLLIGTIVVLVAQIALSPSIARADGLAALPDYVIKAEYRDGWVEGTVQVKVTNRWIRSLWLVQFNLTANTLASSAGSMRVNNVTIDGKEAPFSETNTTVKVLLPKPLRFGRSVLVTLTFRTWVPDTAARFGRSADSVILTGWHPVLAPYSGGWVDFPYGMTFGDPYFFEAGRYEAVLKIPKGWEIVTSAQVVSRDDGAWVLLSDRVRDLSLILTNTGRLSRYKLEGTEVIYLYPKDPDGRLVETIGYSLAYFGRILGPYPYPRLVVAQVPLSGNQGMEFSGMILLNSSLESPEALAVHEIAHQWWYGVVGSDQIHEPWIDEGLTTYLTMLYLEDRYGSRTYTDKEPYYQSLSNLGLPLSTALEEFPSEASYRVTAYGKGAAVWVMARKFLGKQGLERFLRDTYIKHRFGIVDGEAMLQELEEATLRAEVRARQRRTRIPGR